MFEAVGWIINNGSLNIVKDTLVQIHHQFYEQVQNNGTDEFSMSVGRIIERMRASLFRNTIILFDETFSEVQSFFIHTTCSRVQGLSISSLL